MTEDETRQIYDDGFDAGYTEATATNEAYVDLRSVIVALVVGVIIGWLL